MRSHFFSFICTTLISTLSFAQGNTIIESYDSTYDFSEMWSKNRNPKELIGQELEFAPASTKHIAGSEVSIFYALKDSLFICFSSPVVKKIAELTNLLPPNSTGFDLVDCTRHPFNYSYQYLKDSATTNTYKPLIILTDEYPFALHNDEKGIKTAIVVGTPYSALAGKTFKIKDASCYYSYYESNVSYFFNLIDPEKNEVTFYYRYSQPLNQMIHFKGYLKKTEEKYLKKTFSLINSFKIKIGEDPVLKDYYLNTDLSKTINTFYNKKWIAVKYKYVSTPERYFQIPYLELKNEQNEIVHIVINDIL